MSSNLTKSLWVLLAPLLVVGILFPVERKVKIALNPDINMLVYSKIRAFDLLAKHVGLMINREELSRLTIVAHATPVDFDLSELDLPFRGELAARCSTENNFVVGDGSGSDVTTFYIEIRGQGVNLDIGTMAEESPVFSEYIAAATNQPLLRQRTHDLPTFRSQYPDRGIHAEVNGVGLSN